MIFSRPKLANNNLAAMVASLAGPLHLPQPNGKLSHQGKDAWKGGNLGHIDRDHLRFAHFGCSSFRLDRSPSRRKASRSPNFGPGLASETALWEARPDSLPESTGPCRPCSASKFHVLSQRCRSSWTVCLFFCQIGELLRCLANIRHHHLPMDPMLCESFTVVARVNVIPSWRISFCPKCCPAQYVLPKPLRLDDGQSLRWKEKRTTILKRNSNWGILMEDSLTVKMGSGPCYQSCRQDGTIKQPWLWFQMLRSGWHCKTRHRRYSEPGIDHTMVDRESILHLQQ
ncbi:hypothetical protein VFPPC_15561 [Pochonia chlamydosporia 170]|uniref:Uncharacterized protein n=1 Tax=Pochonia chlamydosporia 170 TaxID=1380566 RepID=A0A179FYY9_METCM|nr:hypothetical protein VFPPC_15561 [Pochonia chlamydosporia 170]OAQ70273.1 hypothetical protein VFPPC_15561 [Pochonia chlamydosporia 170]